MKFQLNLITLALLALTSNGLMAAEVEDTKSSRTQVTKTQVTGYNLANANTAKVKFAAWKCQRCDVKTDNQGSVTIGTGYSDSNDIRSANRFNTQDGLAYKVDANIRHKTNSGFNAGFEAQQLGMENSRAQIHAAQSGKYNIKLNYQSIASYDTQSAMTPYLGAGSDNLSLPSNWVTAGKTSDMTTLAENLQPLELSLKRQRMGLALDYQSNSIWGTYATYQRENKTGIKTASGSFFNQSMMLPETVDYTTDNIDAGIKLKGQQWYAVLNYSGSMFNNEYSQLSFDNAFSPTFGAQSRGYLALDPDSQAHTVSVSGLYNDGTNLLSGRMYLGQMTQNEAFITSGYGYELPAESLNAKVDLTGINLKGQHKLTRDLRLLANYDYYDRNNQTQIQQWTQISINDVNGKVAYNKPYDHSSHKLKIAANYRINSTMKLDSGYEYKQDERDYQHRERTNESTLWGRFTLANIENWHFWVKGSYGLKDGSRYQASEITSDENNKLLRRFNLADRNRAQIELSLTYTPIDPLSLDFSSRYASDDYKHSEIGLTDANDFSYDVSVNYLVTQDISANLFYGGEFIESNQNGSSQFTQPTWSSVIEDDIHYIGAGLRYGNLLEDKLKLGLDYHYSDSKSTTQVTQGITGNYGDYFANSHNINLFGEYLATEKMTLRADYQYERYQDNDPANELTTDAIWNVLSFGNLNHNYNAHLVMLSMQYKL